MLYSRIVQSISLTLLLGAIATFAGTASAAPQILALVASKGTAMPMVCVDGRCQTELSSFCLQQSRPTPMPGTRYSAAAPTGLTLVIEQSDGTVRQEPAGDLVTLTSARGSSSVHATLDTNRISRFGNAKLSILVGDKISLLPDPEPGDTNPLTKQEVAITTAGLRSLGNQIVDKGDERIAAARETNRLINVMSYERQTGGRPDAAWDTITAWKPGIRSGQYWANQRISHCESMPAGQALGRCLRDWHDFLMRQMNTDYWDAVRAGS